MAAFETLEKIALSFPEVTVEPHFEKISFRLKKKIFATFDAKNQRITVKLSEKNQDKFTSENKNIFPVDNKWGKQGWTFIELSETQPSRLSEVLKAAYCEVAPQRLADIVQTNER